VRLKGEGLTGFAGFLGFTGKSKCQQTEFLDNRDLWERSRIASSGELKID
jgi:hypothetical protein